MRRDTGPSPEVRAIVQSRLDGMCLRCLRRPGEQIHHRIPRGMGGTRDPDVNHPPNLVWICGDCHRWIESYRDAAREDGWLVWRFIDPEGRPLITLHHSMMIMLAKDGSMVPNPLYGMEVGELPW